MYDNETALEITYKKYITPGITVEPDIQYIIHPGLTGWRAIMLLLD